jgi:hypothetical protein
MVSMRHSILLLILLAGCESQADESTELRAARTAATRAEAAGAEAVKTLANLREQFVKERKAAEAIKMENATLRANGTCQRL